MDKECPSFLFFVVIGVLVFFCFCCHTYLTPWLVICVSNELASLPKLVTWFGQDTTVMERHGAGHVWEGHELLFALQLPESAPEQIFFFSSCRARSRLGRSSKPLVVDQLFSRCSRTGEKQKARCLPKSKQNRPQTQTPPNQTQQRKTPRKLSEN